MSEEQLKAFLEKVKSDTELQNKLNGAADADTVMEIAKEAGFLIAAEDIQSMQSAVRGRELSDADLEGVASGDNWASFGCQNLAPGDIGVTLACTIKC